MSQTKQPLKSVRPSILKQYYERTYDNPGFAHEFDGGELDEYVAVLQAKWPAISRRKALEMSPQFGVGHFRKELENLEPESAPREKTEQELPFWVPIEKMAECELSQAAIDPRVQSLWLNRVKLVRGWSELSSYPHLKILSVTLCSTNDLLEPAPRLRLWEVSISDCSSQVEQVVLRGTRAPKVSVRYSRLFDLQHLQGNSELSSLFVGAQLVRNVHALRHLPLERLRIGSVCCDERLTQLLQALSSTLTDLQLTGTEPFGPDLIPLRDLKKLTHLRVPAYPEYREAWLATACANPHIYFDMSYTAAHEEPAKQNVTVAEIYRDIDILEIKKGKKTTFEVSGEMTEYAEERGFEGDNSDLEDELKERAKTAKVKGLKWSSEGDTLVVQASKIEALRWVIDAILHA